MKKFLVLAVLILCASSASAQISKDEPGWSITVISVAAACRATSDKVDQAAGYVAQWAARNLQDPSKFTKDRVVALVNENEDIKKIVKQKGAFIYPCDRWRRMLDIFVESRGSVMGGVRSEAPKAGPSPSGIADAWNSRGGKCTFFFDPPDPPIDRITLEFDERNGGTLELTLAMNAKGLSVLGRRKDHCRFYGDIKGSIVIGTQKLDSSIGGSTACVARGDGIGAEKQFVEFAVNGGDLVEKALKTILTSDSLSFVLQNGPKAGQSIAVPVKGLKEVIKGVAMCPKPVVRAVAD
jgi:hypothetical protein